MKAAGFFAVFDASAASSVGSHVIAREIIPQDWLLPSFAEQPNSLFEGTGTR